MLLICIITLLLCVVIIALPHLVIYINDLLLLLVHAPPLPKIWRSLRRYVFRPVIIYILVVSWMIKRVILQIENSNAASTSLFERIEEVIVCSIVNFLKSDDERYTKVYKLVIGDIMGVVTIYFIIVIGIEWLSHPLSLRNVQKLKAELANDGLSLIQLMIPPLKRMFKEEEYKLRKSLEASLKDPNRVVTKKLPGEGVEYEALVKDLETRANKEDELWKGGKVSGTVYGGEACHNVLLNKVYALFSFSNPLHTDIWASVNQFEAEVVSMTASIVSSNKKTIVGSCTSGGTESIFLAVKAHLWYFREKYGIKKPEIISSITGHAGIDKACEILGIKSIKVGCDQISFKIIPREVERAISSNTIMIFSSAPTFAQGVIDPIESLSKLAIRYGVGLHVDCCLGGFILPFARKLGYRVPKFDFTLNGVTSMSCDTHKYGYSTKGTSVVLYKHNELRRAQYFTYPDWTGGLYVTPTLAGSRSGALLACAWASLKALGESGFITRTQKIMKAAKFIAEGVSSIPQLRLLGGGPDQLFMIVCFDSLVLNIYQVGDRMKNLRGWSLNCLQNPASIHICVTLPIVETATQFVTDLKTVVSELSEKTSVDNKFKEGGNMAIYGLTQSLPSGPVSDLLKVYTDVTLTA